MRCSYCDHSMDRDGAKIVAARRYLPQNEKGGAQRALLAHSFKGLSSNKLIAVNDICHGLEACCDIWRQAIKLEQRTDTLLVIAQSSLTSLLILIFSATFPGLRFCSHERCCQCPAFCLRSCRIMESRKNQRAVYLIHLQTALVRWSPASPVNGFSHYHWAPASGTGRSLPWRSLDQKSLPNWAVPTTGCRQTHSSNALTQNAWQKGGVVLTWTFSGWLIISVIFRSAQRSGCSFYQLGFKITAWRVQRLSPSPLLMELHKMYSLR